MRRGADILVAAMRILTPIAPQYRAMAPAVLSGLSDRIRAVSALSQNAACAAQRQMRGAQNGSVTLDVWIHGRSDAAACRVHAFNSWKLR